MIPEIGHFALILALIIALVLGILPMIGNLSGDSRMMAMARPATAALVIALLVAFGGLTYAFVTDDFSVLYVASHSNSMLPTLYKVTGVWGGHEGSMLLWVTILALWTGAVAIFSRRLPLEMVSVVLSVLGIISVGFLLFMLLTSNPFERLIPAAEDGRDLNPLLQDVGMAFHPPMLYMGYVGFSVAFAFAIAALIRGRLDAAWARWSRPWTTVAWVFLTLGIALGSYWAYYELGWGGWWFWDPVENASFMPWLVGTALIHSLAVTEKRGSFRNWTVMLAILAFSLSLLGTFLVRSGVLTSVHAFATDPKRGIFVLGFLAFIVGASLLLFAWRAPKVGLGGTFALISRETMLLVNNVLLAVAAGAVLLGTIYPLIIDGLGLGKISVGAPYFDAIFAPLMAPLVIMMGFGPAAHWKQSGKADFWPALAWAAGIAVIGGIIPFFLGKPSVWGVIGMMLGFWALAAAATPLIIRLRSKTTIPLAHWGMVLAHMGIGVFILGVTLVKGYETTAEVKMGPGDTKSLAGYSFKFVGAEEVQGPNYVAARAHIEVSKDGKFYREMAPEKRLYMVQRMPMTEADLDPGFTRDLYVSLGEATEDGMWIVRLQHKPFIYWIWFGCLFMAFGGILAASDRRYRLNKEVL